MKRFLGLFIKQCEPNEMEKIETKNQTDNLAFTILFADTIAIDMSAAEQAAETSNIIKITQEELKNVSNTTGYDIARRIVEERVSSKICSAYVDGGDNGTEWLIKLSDNPLDFID